MPQNKAKIKLLPHVFNDLAGSDHRFIVHELFAFFKTKLQTKAKE